MYGRVLNQHRCNSLHQGFQLTLDPKDGTFFNDIPANDIKQNMFMQTQNFSRPRWDQIQYLSTSRVFTIELPYFPACLDSVKNDTL